MSKITLLFFLLSAFCSFSQEVVSVLKSRGYDENISFKNLVSSKISSFPFFDDFSNSNISYDNWTDRSTLINNSYAINPISSGVATFDGLDSNGFAYDISVTNSYGVADYLTSREIDISNLDSIFLMFFYQPQGVGDFPQNQDSLVLEFLDDSLNWNRVWAINGSSYYPFEKKVIFINDNKFLHQKFRFRFFNYATLSGNFDHWNLDYVLLDKFNSVSDTNELNDVAFVGKHGSLLKRYTQMPWKHFLNNESTELIDSIDIPIRNNDASINVDYKYFVYDQQNNQLSTFPSAGWRNYSINDYDSIGNFSHSPAVIVDDNIFNSFQIDSATFEIKHVIKTGSDDYKYNDTISYIQEFNSSFAYDDGSAESAYGINVTGAKGALQFKLNRPDTLRAVQFYFPQMLDSVSNLDFYLTVWNDNSGKPGDVLYSRLESPRHSRNTKFQTILIDSLFQMSGTFYVGWIQTTDDLLNIGLDLNKNSNQYMFYNYNGTWLNSQYQSSWMIRPIVSEKDILLTTSEIDNLNIKLWPNPSSEKIYFQCSNKFEKLIIYDFWGNEINSYQYLDVEHGIDVRNLSSGLYLFNIVFKDELVTKKIIIKNE